MMANLSIQHRIAREVRESDVILSQPRRGGQLPAMRRYGRAIALCCWIAFHLLGGNTYGEGYGVTDNNPLAMPAVGASGLRVLTPSWLEVTLIGTRGPDPSGSEKLTMDAYAAGAPLPSEFIVKANGVSIPVRRVGFKRRALYAPLKERDLRLGNYLYLELTQPLKTNQLVEVLDPSGTMWPATVKLTSTMHPLRYNPAIHVNQVGYLPNLPKKATVGYYLGTLGELPIEAPYGFFVLTAETRQPVFQGALTLRPDAGYAPTSYQKVLQADFSPLVAPGRYVLWVPGLGISFPFLVSDGTAACLARTYAQGLYHQRCGTENNFPFTRHVHGACHVALADIPTPGSSGTEDFLKLTTADYAENPRHTAPQLNSLAASLYPFVNSGKIDVSGGHHDAGDYSKYTINSAGLIHHLMFAVDSLPGVAALDNMGLPESGDGISDLLQEAKWEADFLAKLQDGDGGFYFLVYPRDRRYEGDVLPDDGDPQVVWPKNTSATAAAVAALAQVSSSPLFRQLYPREAGRYLTASRRGWSFLTNAISRFGWDGSYQQVTHYGDTFMHYDELAWAATEMYLATRDPAYHTFLLNLFSPSDANARRWGWWRLFEGFGCAIRSYAFAVPSGRITSDRLDPTFLNACLTELVAAGGDNVLATQQNAYGTSLPDQTKAFNSVGWYFSGAQGFDLSVANVVQPRADYLDAIVANWNFDAGVNPHNVSFITGLGYRRQREVVHQYAQNDHRTLPPSGLPLGSLQVSFAWLNAYEQQLNALSFPSDNDPTAPYPLYDRWGDSYNVTTEFVVVDQAKCLANAAYWMARTALKTQPWKSATPTISLVLTSQVPNRMLATLLVPGLDATKASVVWETRDLQPLLGSSVLLAPTNLGPQWIEVEANWPDGRRVFAKTSYVATAVSTYTTNSSHKWARRSATADTVAFYRFDGNLADSTGQQPDLTPAGWAMLDDSNLAWMTKRSGKALRVQQAQDGVMVRIPGGDVASANTTAIEIDLLIYIKEFNAYQNATVSLFSLAKGWNSSFELKQEKWATVPFLRCGSLRLLEPAAITTYLTPYDWHRVQVRIDSRGYSARIDDVPVTDVVPSSELQNWIGTDDVTLVLGSFDGWIDEVEIRSR